MMADDDQSFNGTCPTCGQRYCGAEIERLRQAILHVVAAFEKDEMQGYHTKDREYAIMILRKALEQSTDKGYGGKK